MQRHKKTLIIKSYKLKTASSIAQVKERNENSKSEKLCSTVFAKWWQQEKCTLKTKRCDQRPPKGEIHSFKCFWVETKYYNQFSIYGKKLEQEK